MIAKNHLFKFSFECLTFLLFFGLYFFTASPEIFPGANHGELTVAGATLGIAHPTGYPLWINLTHGFTLLPFGSIAGRVNLFMAIVAAFCPVILLLIMRHLNIHRPAAFISTIALGLDLLFWQQATAAEVYGLHILLLSLFFLFLVKSSESDARWFFLACFILALSSANHALTIFYLPLLFISPHARKLRTLVMGFLFGLPGLGTYFYLPVRASTSPGFSWFNPATWSEFLSHISGSQFQQQMLGSPIDLVISRVSAGAGQFLTGTHVLIWPVALLGCFLLIRIDARYRWPIILFLAGNLGFSLTYAIHDIDAYFLPVLWFAAIAAGIGFQAIFSRVSGFRKSVALGCLFFVFLWGFSQNYSPADRSGVTLATDYGKCLLRSCPDQSVLYFQGDNPTNSLSYLYFIEHRRKDITFIDMNGNLRRFGNVRSNKQIRPVIKTFRGIANRKFLNPWGIAYMKPPTLQYQPPVSDIVALPGIRVMNRKFHEPAFRELTAEYLINRGEFASERGDWQAGHAIYQKADEIAHDIPNVRRFIAALLASRGWLSDAIGIEEEMLSSGNCEPADLNNLSFHLYMSCTQLDRATDLAEEAVHQDPDEFQFRRTLAQIYIVTGRLSDAKSILKNQSGNTRDLLNEINRLENAVIESPEMDLNLFDGWEDGVNSESALVQFRKLMAWRHARVLLKEQISSGVTDSEILTLYASTSRTCGTVPDALESLETLLRNTADPNVQKILRHLHDEEFNAMRAASLIPSNSADPGDE